jgi:transposase
MGQENLSDTALYRENGAAAWRASRASSKVTEAVRQQVQSWIGKQADLTLAELQLRLYEERNLEISLSRLWTVLGGRSSRPGLFREVHRS